MMAGVGTYRIFTIPKTNIATENRPGPKRKIHLPTIPLSGVNTLLVSGRILLLFGPLKIKILHSPPVGGRGST